MAFNKDDKSLASIGTTIKQAIHLFSSATRKSIHMLSSNSPISDSKLGETYRTSQDLLFKSQDVPLHRLYQVGIMNPLQSTRILPSLSEEEQDHIHKTIIGLIGPTDSTTIENLKNGSLKVCSQKINLNQKIPWGRPTGATEVQDPLSGDAIFVPSKSKATKQAWKWKPAVKNTSSIKRYFMPTSEEDRGDAPPDRVHPQLPNNMTTCRTP